VVGRNYDQTLTLNTGRNVALGGAAAERVWVGFLKAATATHKDPCTTTASRIRHLEKHLTIVLPVAIYLG